MQMIMSWLSLTMLAVKFKSFLFQLLDLLAQTCYLSYPKG